MSGQKMRGAFEVWWRAVLNDPYKELGIDDKHVARLAWDAALAQPPAAVVELTDAEIIFAAGEVNRCPCDECRVGIARRVLAAHIIKQQEKGYAE